MDKKINKKVPVPLYIQLANILREKILDEMSASSYVGTLKSLIEEYEVSEITVRKAIDALKEEGTVRTIKSKGIFVERVPESRDNGEFMAFIAKRGINSVLNPMYTRIFEGAKFFLTPLDVKLEFFTPEEIESGIIPAKGRFKGLIIAGVGEYQVYEPVIAAGMDFVLADILSDSFSCVLTDNYAGGRTAARHLIDSGCRKMSVFRGFRENESFNLRFKGFCDELSENGIGLNDEFVIEAFNIPASERSGVIKKLFSSGAGPDSIFFTADEYAFLYMPLLKRAGIRIPEDLNIIGYDNLEAASCCVPSLTTIKQPMFEIGKTAAEFLLSEKAKKTDPFKKLIIPQLIKRKSTKAITEKQGKKAGKKEEQHKQ